MGEETTDRDGPTRRNYVKYGGALVAGGWLAGCTDQSGEGGDATETADGARETPTSEEPASTETAMGTATDDGSYTVQMSPAGEVEFEEPPKDLFTVLTHHAGMAVAAGRGDDVNAIYAGGYYEPLWNKFLERLDGVSVSWSDLPDSLNADKELLYDLDSDVHLADPANVATMDGWSADDVAEIRESVAPWFGNRFSASHGQPPDGWADDYQYYSLWEIFGKVAAALREEARYRELAAVHDEMLATIEEGLPPAEERPSAALVLFSPEDADMWQYELNGPGFFSAHTRPLGAPDAFAEAGIESGENGQIDQEALVEADPDVILALAGMAESRDMDAVREQLRDNPATAEITAVQDERVHPQGARWQGPLLNLFQLEMTAKQLYPERFGEWPTYVDGPYPEIPEDERLFDRERVARIVTEGADAA